jgi:hypothetical protein
VRLRTGVLLRPAPQVLIQAVGQWPTLIGAVPQRSRFALPDGARSGDVPARGRDNRASAGEGDLMVQTTSGNGQEPF